MAKHTKKRKKSRFWKFFCVITLGVLGVTLIGGAVALNFLSDSLLDKINFKTESGDSPIIWNEADSVEQPDVPINLANLEVRGDTKNIHNYFLLGIDSRDGSFYGRSDTMMIASVNDTTKKIKLISLLRDTWATIPGMDYNGDGADDYAKLNAAYASGGFELLNKTVKQNFCLDIDEYAAVNFDAFCVAVDAFGGVDIEVDDAAAPWIPLYDPGDPDRFARDFYGNQIREPIGYYGGTYHLEGFQALAFCRVRYCYPNSDFSRQQNQRNVVSALLSTAKSSSPKTLLNVAKEVLPNVTTNMTKKELEKYIVNVFKYTGYTIENEYHLPQPGEYSDLSLSGSLGLWIEDPETTVRALHEYIYG